MVHNEFLTPITDVLLEQDQLLAIAIPRTEGGFNAFAFQVTRTAPLRKEITEMQDIAVGGTVTADKLGESGHVQQVGSGNEGNSVFRLDKEDEPLRLYHFGQLWDPEDLQIYFENPNGELPQGWTRDTTVAVGDDEGWTAWSDNTKFTDKIPSTELETIILPGVTPFIGFENTGSSVASPTALFHGRAYEVNPLNELDLDLAVRVVTGLGVKRDLKMFGGLDEFSVASPDEWGDEISLTGEELAAILRTKVVEGETTQQLMQRLGGA